MESILLPSGPATASLMGFAGTLCFSFPGNLTQRHLPPRSASSLGLSQLPNVGEKCEGESVASQLYSQSAPVLVLLPLKASSPGFELGATVSFGLSVILNPEGLELVLCCHLFVPELHGLGVTGGQDR